MTTQQVREFGATPPGFGSMEEWIVYSILLQLGLRDGEDFEYQTSIMGGRTQAGGFVIDFRIWNPPDLAINPQGVYWHYEKGDRSAANDLMLRAMLAAQGITLIFIDADELTNRSQATFMVREALNYRDHSRLSARG